MTKTLWRKTLVAAGLLAALGAVGCGGSEDGPGTADASTLDGAVGTVDASGGTIDGAPGAIDAAPTPDAVGDHTENNSGVLHMPGKSDPLENCVSCHGADLTGGTGPSCYTCHNNDDHLIDRDGNMHLAGLQSTCTTCHGPSNSGGLGPACSTCH